MKIHCLTLSVCLCSANAFAVLGGAPSLPAPRVLSSNPVATMPAPATRFTESQQTLASGTELREWVNTDGIVFALSWSGPFLPDLREQLGMHFQVLTDAQKRRTGLRVPVRVQQADLVIVSGGRMGAFEGRAWIPSLLPAGFDTATIQ